ncbi:hypothetical protein D3C72_2092260 [compost metagenome]
MSHDLPKPFVSFKQSVQRRQLLDIRDAERLSFTAQHKFPEPLAQASGLRRDAIELAGHGLCAQRIQRACRHKARLLYPRQEAATAVYPVDLHIGRRGDGVEEIKSHCIGNEYRGRAVKAHVSTS